MQVVAVREDLQTTLQIVREQVLAQQRDPLRKFKKRVRELNYGPCDQLQPLTLNDVSRVDVHASCNYYSRCFRDPAEFTLCFVGALTSRCQAQPGGVPLWQLSCAGLAQCGWLFLACVGELNLRPRAGFLAFLLLRVFSLCPHHPTSLKHTPLDWSAVQAQ